MRLLKAASLCAVTCALVATAGHKAVAQDVLAGTGAGYESGGATGFGVGAANTTTLALWAGIGEMDNVLLASSAKQSQTVATAGLNVTLSRRRPRLNTNIRGNFQDLYYVQNAFSNQLTGRFDGDATVGLVQNRLNWVIDESYGQGQLNPVAPLVPTNLQNVNVVSTGPDLLLHPGGRTNFLQLGARYGRTDFETSPFSGHQELGLVALGRELSGASTLALHAEVEKLRFSNNVLNTDYTLRRAYASYGVHGARTEIELNAGAVQTNDVGRQWSTRPFGTIAITRELSPRMTISLEGGREVTNITGSFANLQSGAAESIVVAPVYGTTRSYARTYGLGTWGFALNRTSISASARWEQDSYESTNILNTRIGDYQLRLERALTPALQVAVSGTLRKTDYYRAQFETDLRTLNVTLAFRPAQKLQISLEYQYTSQGTSGVVSVLTRSGYFNLLTTTPVYVTDSYSANAVFLKFTYLPLRQ